MSQRDLFSELLGSDSHNQFISPMSRKLKSPKISEENNNVNNESLNDL